MSKLMTWIVISIFLLSLFVFTGCLSEKKEKAKSYLQEEDYSTDFYEDDKVIVKVQTPSGVENTYEGTIVKWWHSGVVLKTDSGRILIGIAGQVFTVEKQITR